MDWQPIETAPRGGGADDVRDPAWVEPPKILVCMKGGERAVARWDWYYAEGGSGCIDGNAWVLDLAGEPLALLGYGAPTHWQPLPEPPNISSPVTQESHPQRSKSGS